MHGRAAVVLAVSAAAIWLPAPPSLAAGPNAVVLSLKSGVPTIVPGLVTGQLVEQTGTALGVYVPPPGQTELNAIDMVTGAQGLMISTLADGSVSATYNDDVVVGQGGSGPTSCADSAYNLETSNPQGAKQYSAYGWYLNINSAPIALNHTAVIGEFRAAVKNIRQENNICARPDTVSATASYLGTTPRNPDLTSSATCQPSTDGVNVEGFGQINSSSILATACVISVGHSGPDAIIESDVLVNTNMSWYVTGTSCSSAWNIQAVMTHEFGHTFGLAHVNETNHPNLTMSSAINGTCQKGEASLGYGDMLGLESLY